MPKVVEIDGIWINPDNVAYFKRKTNNVTRIVIFNNAYIEVGLSVSKVACILNGDKNED